MNNNIEQERIKDEFAKFKKNQTILLMIITFVNFIISIGIAIYFKIKEMALLGVVYVSDESIGTQVTSSYFNLKINPENIEAGKNAMQQSGYGRNGFSYISRLNGEMYALFFLIFILLILLIAGVYNCIRIGRTSLYYSVTKLCEDNSKLRADLQNEQHFNEKQQKKVMDFIENIAHQIKTPLSVISMKLELLKGKSKETMEEPLDICINNAFRIKALIKKLLDLSRLEAGKVIFTDDEIEMDSLILESINICDIGADSISVNFDDEKINIYADEDWLIEAFVNVLDNCNNSIKSVKDGRIFIDMSKNKDICEVVISDNGKGLSIEQFNNIFNRFETFSNQSEFSCGIGLNLSKIVIESHNGTIKAGNSEKYGGAEFKITLPIYRFKNKVKNII